MSVDEDEGEDLQEKVVDDIFSDSVWFSSSGNFPTREIILGSGLRRGDLERCSHLNFVKTSGFVSCPELKQFPTPHPPRSPWAEHSVRSAHNH